MPEYTNNLRLKEIATGDESGTWGTSTNTNLELIGEALGFGTEGITTNADTHTTTVADGSADEGRAMYIKYTGTLDSACTITIGPNTLKRVHIIENATSGSQNIIISQGSGANVTIGPGNTKVVYLDGAIVTFAPDPCDIIMFCEPLVAFSIICTLFIVFGPIVIVQAESNVPVYFIYSALPASEDPSAIVVVCVSAFVVMASVPKPNASPINSKFVLVEVPHVPDSSPVAISFNLRLLTYVAIMLPFQSN